jgi:hypothetical protein
MALALSTSAHRRLAWQETSADESSGCAADNTPASASVAFLPIGRLPVHRGHALGGAGCVCRSTSSASVLLGEGRRQPHASGRGSVTAPELPVLGITAAQSDQDTETIRPIWERDIMTSLPAKHPRSFAPLRPAIFTAVLTLEPGPSRREDPKPTAPHGRQRRSPNLTAPGMVPFMRRDGDGPVRWGTGRAT